MLFRVKWPRLRLQISAGLLHWRVPAAISLAGARSHIVNLSIKVCFKIQMAKDFAARGEDPAIRGEREQQIAVRVKSSMKRTKVSRSRMDGKDSG